ncbi:unnamed protein product [Caenorhabditis brenneri]
MSDEEIVASDTLTNTETEISDAENDTTDTETSSVKTNPYADDLIMFQNNPRPPGDYIKLIKKLFDEVAPNATQEQKDLLRKLTKSIVKANIHAVNECREKFGETLPLAKEELEKSEETFDLFRTQLVQTENQISFFGQLAKNLTEKNAERLKICREVQQECEAAGVAKNSVIQEMNKDKIDYDKKYNDAQRAHEAKVKALREEIQKLKREKMAK